MPTGTVDPQLYGSMRWRLIGPHRGGRVVAVAGHPTETATFYFGAVGGGVWKTTDAGSYWENISDGYFNTAAIGALAISKSDPNVIYAGTGETAIRGDVSHGDGVYRSTDGGQTWQNVGLEDTRHIGRIRIHPNNPDIVYVAALGHAWGPNKERGVFRSKDGGQTWEKMLYKSDKAGAIDLSMDVNNPRVLYASIWEAQRYPHDIVSGGDDSGIWKSTDGGDTWHDITRNPGLPEGQLGKIGVAVSPANSNRVWALIEAEDGAMFRSDDAGSTWERLSEQSDLRRRAWYYMHVIASPTDENTVWVMNNDCWRSVDGGKTFDAIPTPHGDNHDLWIDPRNAQRMIQGNDGGANVSLNGAKSWSTIYNQPTAQFYHVTTDNRCPYWVYGSQQDNTALALPSQSANGAITTQEWIQPGGGESGYIAVNSENPNIVYGGAQRTALGPGRIIRYDHSSFEEQLISPWPDVMGVGRGAEGLKYRFQWTFPIETSPHNPNVLRACSQHVHETTDEGYTWRVISPDLTRNDPEKLKPAGGPITLDNSGAEYYCTIFAFRESPHKEGVLWAGSDDGRIHVSQDAGANWEEITPPADMLPEWSRISIIELSPHQEGKAYVAANRYQLDDDQPYLLKTEDHGQSWTEINNGIRPDDITRTIREDPNRQGLLYCGTETGLYVSFDDGANWQVLQNNLPVCPIYDLVVKDADLVVATHGRSFWILDDLSLLHQINDEVKNADFWLFQPNNTKRFTEFADSISSKLGKRQPRPNEKSYGRISGMLRTSYQRKTDQGDVEDVLLDVGQNPLKGVVIHYYLKDQPKGEVKLAILDSDGNVVRSFSTAAVSESKVPSRAGSNRFVWDMRYPPASPVEDSEMPTSRQTQTIDYIGPEALKGPGALPGKYSVRLEVAGQGQTREFEIEKDPRIKASDEDLQAQFDLLIELRDKLSETITTIDIIRRYKAQLEGWANRDEMPAIKDQAHEIKRALEEIENELVQATPQDPPRAFPIELGLSAMLGALSPQISSANRRPTQPQIESAEEVMAAVDYQLEAFRQLMSEEVQEFNQLVRKEDLPALAN